MSGLTMFFLGIGLVLVTVVAVGVWWFSARSASMKLPGVPRTGWIFIVVLILVVALDFLFGKPVLRFVMDAFTDEGEPRVWLWAVAIAVLLSFVLMFFRRKAGTDLLQGIIIASIIVALATFVLDKFSTTEKTGGLTKYGLECPQVIHLRHLEPGDSQEICIESGGLSYILYFSTRMGNRAIVRFDDTPLRVKREFELFPNDWKELVNVGYFGDGSEFAVGLVSDTLRIAPIPIGWRKYQLTKYPVYFEVYIQ